jgi:hypothetical protein
MNVIQQSHKTRITNTSINSFTRFARQYNICLADEKADEFIPNLISDVYEEGMEALEEDFKRRKGGLDRLKPAYMFDQEIECPEKPQSTSDSDDSNTTDNSEDTDSSNSSVLPESFEDSGE